jgi:hypothetical protein
MVDFMFPTIVELPTFNNVSNENTLKNNSINNFD